MKRIRAASLGAALLIASIANGAAAATGGNGVYDVNCAFCHQVRGIGLAGQFPRLAGRVDVIAADPAGRSYLIAIVLHGMAGRIEVDGAPMTGLMPGFPTMSDADVAAVLNYVSGLSDSKGKRPPQFTAKAVAAARAAGAMSAADVLARRASLASRGVVPK
jgi:mono/diheme cytochrome c family protein